MKTRRLLTRPIRCVAALLALAVLLAGCVIEGGVPEATPEAVSTTAPPAPTTVQPDTTAATNVALRNDTWTIGLLDAPRDLYPYQPGAAQQRVAAPITELLFPSPILIQNFGYTNTGVLERIPTLENGGVTRRKADVFLDAAGQITTTTTEVITQVDQLVVTYEWNPKLSWSDGTPVTAADSVFAYEVAKAAPPNDDARDRLEQTVTYEAVDDHTTRAILKPDLVGSNYFMNVWTPLPRHLLKNQPLGSIRSSPFARAPVGYGPYKLTSVSPAEVQLERNPYYFGTPPAAARATIAFFPTLERLRAELLNGNLDAAATDRFDRDIANQLDQDSKSGLVNVSYVHNPIWEHIDFNLDVKMLQDYRVRRAIALGTNRKAMAKAIYGNNAEVLNSWILPGEEYAAPNNQLSIYGYSPRTARELLDEGGYTLQPDTGLRMTQDGFTLTLQLLTTANNPVRSAIAEQFRKDMREIGIAVDVVEVPNEELFDANGPLYLRQFELVLFGWGAGPEPGGLALWSCAAVPSDRNGFTGENFAGWCFLGADRAIRTAATSFDPKERQSAYLQQQQLWTQELPSLPLFQRVGITAVAPRVQGPQPDPFAPITWNIATWKRSGD